MKLVLKIEYKGTSGSKGDKIRVGIEDWLSELPYYLPSDAEADVEEKWSDD